MIETLATDTNIWMVFSFIIFMFILIKAAKSVLANVVDGRIEKIKRELKEAENLHTEAQELLAQYKRKHANALKESEEIIENAEQYATKIRKQAKKEIRENLDRREEQLADRIALMKENAIVEIQRYAADMAIDATRDIIAKNMSKKIDKALIDGGVNDLVSKAG